MKKIIFLGTCFLTLLPCLVFPAAIQKIEITGTKTHPRIIQKFFDSRPGKEFDPETWKKDLQRIRNSDLFYEIHDEPVDPLNPVLRLHLKNKFSMIPILKFKQGGGSSQITAGIYDVNLLNRLLEAGGQYERLNSQNGGVVWFRHPYFLSRKNKLGIEFYVHTIDLPLLTDKGEEEAFFDNKEFLWNFQFLHEWNDHFDSGVQLVYLQNSFVEDRSAVFKEQLNARFLSRNPLRSGVTVSLVPGIGLGRIDRDRFYVQGHRLDIFGEIANSRIGSDFDFVSGELRYNSGYRPHEKINVAFQFRMGSKSGRELQHKFYLGGLDTIRGFLDGQFRGDHMWFGNFEIRPTLFERSLWVLQGNLFTDWSKTWDATNFGMDGFSKPFISYGSGFRVILPRIYRAVLRVDFAWTQEPIRDFGFNMALQQFF